MAGSEVAGEALRQRPSRAQEHALAVRIGGIPIHGEATKPDGRGTGRACTAAAERIHQVDEPVVGEARVDGHGHEPPRSLGADERSQVDERTRTDAPVHREADDAVLLGHEYPSVRQQGEVGGIANAASDNSHLEVVRQGERPSGNAAEVLKCRRRPDPAIEPHLAERGAARTEDEHHEDDRERGRHDGCPPGVTQPSTPDHANHPFPRGTSLTVLGLRRHTRTIPLR